MIDDFLKELSELCKKHTAWIEVDEDGDGYGKNYVHIDKKVYKITHMTEGVIESEELGEDET